MDRERKREHWATLLTEWEASGLSGAAFCRERELVYQQFLYRRRRLQAEAEEKGDATGRFVPMAFEHEQDTGRGCGVRVRVGADLELVLERGFDETELRRAVEVLRVAGC